MAIAAKISLACAALALIVTLVLAGDALVQTWGDKTVDCGSGCPSQF
ncbi:hypothetical protein [Pelagibacterium montanilacus]|nr:hypothetical protein [Pelagibacterium montanilacus]